MASYDLLDTKETDGGGLRFAPVGYPPHLAPPSGFMPQFPDPAVQGPGPVAEPRSPALGAVVGP